MRIKPFLSINVTISVKTAMIMGYIWNHRCRIIKKDNSILTSGIAGKNISLLTKFQMLIIFIVVYWIEEGDNE